MEHRENRLEQKKSWKNKYDIELQRRNRESEKNRKILTRKTEILNIDDRPLASNSGFSPIIFDDPRARPKFHYFISALSDKFSTFSKFDSFSMQSAMNINFNERLLQRNAIVAHRRIFIRDG